MTNTILDQKLAVNPFGKRIDVDKRPEQINELKMDNKLQDVLEVYEQLTKVKMYEQDITPYKTRLEDLIGKKPLGTLNPSQINLFLTYAAEHYSDRFEVLGSGLMLSYLIQKSYDAGHNDFKLDTLDIKMIDLVVALEGKSDDYIRININGPAGDEFGRSCRYCDFTIQGETGWACGTDAKHSKFTFKSFVDFNCAYGSNACTYTFLQKEELLEHQTFPQAADCILQITSEEAYKSIISRISHLWNNTVQLVDKTGRIIIGKKHWNNTVQLVDKTGKLIIEKKHLTI